MRTIRIGMLMLHCLVVCASANVVAADREWDCDGAETGGKTYKVYELPPYWVSYEIYGNESRLFRDDFRPSYRDNIRRVVVLADGMVIREDVRMLGIEKDALSRRIPVYETTKKIYQLNKAEKEELKSLYSFNLMRALKVRSFRNQRTHSISTHLILSVVHNGEHQSYSLDQGSEYSPRQLEAIVYDIDRLLSQPEIMARKHKNNMLDGAEQCFLAKTVGHEKLLHITQDGIDIPVRFDGLIRDHAMIINGGLKVVYCGDRAYGETVFLVAPRKFTFRDAWRLAEETFTYTFPESLDIKGGLVFTEKNTGKDNPQGQPKIIEDDQDLNEEIQPAYGVKKGTVKTVDGKAYAIELKVEKVGRAYRLYTKVSKP